jgi:hypothetical protein
MYANIEHYADDKNFEGAMIKWLQLMFPEMKLAPSLSQYIDSGEIFFMIRLTSDN